MTKAEQARLSADEKAARDGKTFYQRYLESAVQVEGRFYFHPGGIVSCEPTAPTRDEVVASAMKTLHIVYETGGDRRTYYPTREQAEAMYDGAIARRAAGPTTPPLPKRVGWRDRSGHLHYSTPIVTVDADGSREEWPPLELRETNG